MRKFNQYKTLFLFLVLSLTFQNCSPGFKSIETQNGSYSSSSNAPQDSDDTDNDPGNGGSNNPPPTSGGGQNAGTWLHNDPVFPASLSLGLEVINGELEKAYPGLAYSHRLAVRGGSYPYQFRLTRAPAQFRIHSRKGLLQWASPVAGTHAINIEIKDSAGQVLQHNFNLEVTTSGFYFVSPNGNDSATGLNGAPLRTFAGLQAKNFDKASIVYFHEGSYTLATTVNVGAIPRRLLGYPGQTKPRVNCNNMNYCFSSFPGNSSNYLFQGFEFYNTRFKYFNIDSSRLSKVTWRNNYFHDLHVDNEANSWENPSFIYFWDGNWSRDSAQLLNGTDYRNKHIIIQDNEFSNMSNYGGHEHASSACWYDVHFGLFEDNVVHGVDGGYGLHDKDDGWFNTIRGNRFYDISGPAISISNQYTSSDIEISHNLILGSEVRIGAQPGFIRNIVAHHNTIINASFTVNGPISDANSNNVVLKNNFMRNTTESFYHIDGSYNPGSRGDVAAEYVTYIIGSPRKVTMNNNLLYRTAGNSAFIRWSWGSYSYNQSQFAAVGQDVNSLFMDPTVSTDGNYSLLSSDARFGVYGKDVSAGQFVDAP